MNNYSPITKCLMKRYLLFFSLTMLLCTQCTLFSSKDDDSDVNFDDFPLDEIINYEIIHMGIGYYNEDESQVYLTVPHTLAPESAEVSLSINGAAFALKSEYVGGFTEYWSDEESYYPGQEVAYALQIGQASYSGDLYMPTPMTVSFPEEFDMQSDFSFNWSTDTDPDLFLVYFGIDYRPSSSWEYHRDWFLIEGSRRNYTIAPGQYPEIPHDELRYVDIEVIPINFDLDDDFVAWAATYSDVIFTQSFSMEYSKRVPGNRNHPGFPHRR